MNLPVGTKVEVKWVDIISEPSWIKIQEIEEPPTVKTVGYFIGVKTYHLKECLILAGSIQDNEISNVDIIPMGTIISLENLSE